MKSSEPEEVTAAPEAWRAIGEEITEQLDDQPARFLRRCIIRKKYVQIDETPVEHLNPGNGATKQGYLWACKRPGSDVSFTWATSRAARCLDPSSPPTSAAPCSATALPPIHLFANRSEGRITLAACWAHARRKFHEAAENTPQQAR